MTHLKTVNGIKVETTSETVKLTDLNSGKHFTYMFTDVNRAFVDFYKRMEN